MGGLPVKIIRLFSAALLTVGALMALSQANATTDPNVLSKANQALFTTDHLASIHQPSVLVYDFEKKGSLEPGFTDTVEETITKVWPNGHKDLSFHFLTGTNHIEFHDFPEFTSNPVFMLFLERDVRELQRQTHGNALYFRTLIRQGLAGAATMAPTTFDFNGVKHKGTEIRVQPYINDPTNERYPEFAKKTYIFILSDEIPGGIYKVDAITPGPTDDQPITDESVTFREIRSSSNHAESGGNASGKEN